MHNAVFSISSSHRTPFCIIAKIISSHSIIQLQFSFFRYLHFKSSHQLSLLSISILIALAQIQPSLYTICSVLSEVTITLQLQFPTLLHLLPFPVPSSITNSAPVFFVACLFYLKQAYSIKKKKKSIEKESVFRG